MVVASAPITFEEIGMIYNITLSFFPIGYYQEKNENTSKSGKSRKEKKHNFYQG